MSGSALLLLLLAVACADPETKPPASKLDTTNGGSGGTSGNPSTTVTTSSVSSGGSPGSGAATTTSDTSTGGTTTSSGSGGGAGDDGSGGSGGGGSEDPCGSAGAGGEPMSGDELFFEDFESGTDRWQSSPETTFSVVEDQESMSNTLGNGEIINQPRVAYLTDGCFTDVIVEARVKVLEFPGSSTTYVAGPCLRVESDEDFYIVGIQGNGNAGLVRVVNGSRSSLQSDSSVDLVEGQWYSVRVEAVGSRLRGYIDDELLLDDDDSELSFGSIGVCTSNADAIFDDVRVTLP